MTTILLTGGTGFIGRHPLGELVKRKDAEVFALVRPKSVGKLSGWGRGSPRSRATSPAGASVCPPRTAGC
ncbi:MAG TPA: SDR family oxidoreductase [Candidatus Dormibacteraeota bacterium]|nr:SDR family oxidoreductase [Candidatus Dormibacteraeota bacterium]